MRALVEQVSLPFCRYLILSDLFREQVKYPAGIMGKWEIMALWQYSFFVLPKTALPGEFFSEQVEDGFALFDDDPYWRDAKFPCINFSELEVILPKGKSWSEKLTIYGNDDSNCLQVLCEDGIALSVDLRIDFTTDYEPVLRMLIEFFISQELILLDQELNPVALNFETVQNRIENSLQVSIYRKLSSE